MFEKNYSQNNNMKVIPLATTPHAYYINNYQAKTDQYQYLGNCAPTSPLDQHVISY